MFLKKYWNIHKNEPKNNLKEPPACVLTIGVTPKTFLQNA